MKKIKEFAALCKTSPKTLRFYDRIGLLEAAYTDPENGYRYYNEGQRADYDAITRFKEIGFTLDEIRSSILGAEAEKLLGVLYEKEAALKAALEACTVQITSCLEKLRTSTDRQILRYDREGKIVVSGDGVTRVFSCSPEGMDICADVLRELVMMPAYVNLSLADIPEPTDADCAVFVQQVQGTLDEILALPAAAFFAPDDHPEAFTTVLLALVFDGTASLDEVTAAAEKFMPCFSDSAAIIWGAEFRNSSDSSGAKISLIGIL